MAIPWHTALRVLLFAACKLSRTSHCLAKTSNGPVVHHALVPLRQVATAVCLLFYTLCRDSRFLSRRIMRSNIDILVPGRLEGETRDCVRLVGRQVPSFRRTECTCVRLDERVLPPCPSLDS
jgi:hypothetical protein